jgi:5-methylcytosine-specific restriction endonuclease McrA
MKFHFRTRRLTMNNIMARDYGGLILNRGICDSCGEDCIICNDGTSSCCGATVKTKKNGSIVKEVDCVNKNIFRKKPKCDVQKKILQSQDNKCYWCGRVFGSNIISPRGILKTVDIVWDHYIPYSITGTSRPENFVASCQRCNGHKNAKVISAINTEDSLKEYLKRRWYRNGWTDFAEEMIKELDNE